MSKPKYIEKLCKRHGLTEFVLESRGYYRCPKCRVFHVSQHRVGLKLKAIAYLGGKCRNCGYAKCKDALQFNHLNDKTSDLSKLIVRGFTWNKLVKELDKCELLCANCHAEHHYKGLDKLAEMDYCATLLR